MSSQRRGGASDLRDALMALVRTTLDQVGAVRDAAVRQAQSQRHVIDQALLSRRRKEALSALGEEVFARMLAGELDDLAREPSVAEHVATIAELDDAIAAADVSEDEPAKWDRSRAKHGSPAKIWRPTLGESDAGDEAEVPAKPRRRTQRVPTGERRGGIQFVAREEAASDIDDDLEDYMHEDDLPSDGDEQS